VVKMEFKTKIYNSTTIGNKTLKIEFRAEDLEEIKSLLNKVFWIVR